MIYNDFGIVIFDRSSSTNRNSDPNKDQGMAGRSKNVRYAIINIDDSGQGIDKGIKPTLFTKYGSLSTQGMGFGLYLAKKITEAHGHMLRAQ